ncbi:terminase gpA endonuclease subunit [Serratia ureilytica]|uniref:terminase gpA endonuclease subunit n=1 Tax=Serratia ureilytica TaxID=300181 RepID=UPI0019D302AD|nr:terminase gpA endonuclease subunit [Serratia ureilytica]MBN5214269.1 phage terminase large subunit family protein [Serratia ureilytica]
MFKNKLATILKKSQKFIVPPPILIPSEWIKANLKFPDGPEAGRPMKLFKFQEGMVNAINEDKKKIVFMTSAQIGKTTILNGVLFYKTANDPGNAGVLQATGRETAQWLAGKIRPMIEASEMMQNLVTEKNDRNAVNNGSQVQLKSGGFWYMMSLNSPSHLRGKTLPLMLLDEVDAVETESEEGNPIIIAEQRATTFGEEARIFICSTPTGKYGAINTQYEASDKRKFHVPCPKCGHMHELIWENVKFEKRVLEGKQIPDPSTAYIECPECAHRFTDGDRARAINKGTWVITNPGASTIGFHISRLYSPVSTIKSVVQDYADAFQSYSLSTFYNTVLGLPFDDLNQDVEVWKLEQLKTDIDFENIDDDVQFLTCGIDLQGDRIEATVLGHTKNRIDVQGHKIFRTISTSNIQDKSYRELLAFLKAPWKTVTGRKIPMAWANMDSGDNTKTVYRFCTTWTNLKAIKGANSLSAPLVPVKATNTGGYELYSLGVNTGKTMIREILNRATRPGITKPIDVRISRTAVPDDYCEQLTSEELKRSGNSQRWVLKPGGVRNECLDTFNYALAARQQVLDLYNWSYWYNQKAPEVDQEVPEEIVDEPIDERPKVQETRPRVRIQRPNAPKRKRGWLS